MPHNRYYIDAAFEDRVTISGDEWHHLARVLRARQGDRVELVNGSGQLGMATVEQLHKSSAELRLDKVIERPSPPPLILAQALPRMNHLEWIVEKGTELNATAFWLFPGILSEKEGLSDAQMLRLKHLCISAMKQCGRLDLPEILLKPPLLQWGPVEGLLLFGDTAENAPYFWELSQLSSPTLLFIGPEKGFEPRETAFLTRNLKAQGVRLHPNILRAETAPLVGLCLIQSLRSKLQTN